MYAPGFKIYISTEKNGILDVSDDVTQGSIVRRSSGVSSLSFVLQNARRKYDGIFTPNDRVIVMMKRLAWMRVFTGYLNAVPLVTAWPMAVQMTASCSLKRLQYFFWDPGLGASQTLIRDALNATKLPDDGGVANVIVSILNTVVGWPAANVHIAGIPQTWTSWAYKIAKNLQSELAEADALAQQFYAQLGANGIVGGMLPGGQVASGALKAGTYGGVNLTQAQANVAVQVYNAGISMKATGRDINVALAVAMAESALGVNTTGNLDSVGVFQQRPSQGWGTAAQLTDANYAATQFFTALMKITGRERMTIGQEGQAVQKSAHADGSNYQKFADMGNQIVNSLGSATSTSPSSGAADTTTGAALGPQNAGAGTAGVAKANTAPSNTGVNPGKAGKTSSNSLLQTALNLVQAHPSIPYQLGGDSAPNTAVPTVLDCSSFVQWVYFHTFGSLGSCPRTSEAQSSWCQSAGTIVPADQAMKTQGALMFMGAPGSAHHVEISLGDGTHTVGAHHSGTYAGVVSSAGAWTNGGLAPGLDYTGAAGQGGGAANANPLNAGVQLSTGSAQPWYNPHDKFDTLFGSGPWVAQPFFSAALTEALTGPRSLIADSPVLPYIKNLVGSTMREFSSAPNGDFIAWFPDYYGIWKTAAIMQIEPIELRDFTVWWDDTNLVTHQFVVCPLTSNQIDSATGTVANMGPLIATTTAGVATIDIPAIMTALFGLEPTQGEAQKFIDWVYKRFGARPDFQTMVGPVGPQGEFFAALHTFMQSWAYQYNADIPITFMPELWPGMLVQVPEFGFQAYVTTVTHTWQMGPGGGYTTTVNIAAPARLPGNDGKSQGHLIGMPLAGGLASSPSLPGTGSG
jgi:cell wall-associated NlpC family hydrolase